MSISYPRKWADFHGFLRDRVDVSAATEFVKHMRSYQFGALIELKNMHAEQGSDPDADPAVQTERELRDALQSVIDWLHDLEADGQETISTRKVLNRIEDETGYEVEFTE